MLVLPGQLSATCTFISFYTRSFHALQALHDKLGDFKPTIRDCFDETVSWLFSSQRNVSITQHWWTFENKHLAFFSLNWTGESVSQKIPSICRPYWAIFAFQAVCLLFAKEFSKQSIIFEISKLNWCKRLTKNKLVTIFCNSCFFWHSFLTCLDHTWEFLAFQAVGLFFSKELSQQSAFFGISKQAFGIVFAKPYWCKRLTKNKHATHFFHTSFSNIWQVFLTFLDRTLAFLAFQAVGLFFPKELSQLSAFFVISKQSIWHFLRLVKAPHQKQTCDTFL